MIIDPFQPDQQDYSYQEQEDIQCYQKGRFIKLQNQSSFNQISLQGSLENILLYYKKRYLNILITDIGYMELLGKFYEKSNIGISFIPDSDIDIINRFYSNRVQIINSEIKNACIDVLITDNTNIADRLVKCNTVNVVYSIKSRLQIQSFKEFRSIISGSYMYINMFSQKKYQCENEIQPAYRQKQEIKLDAKERYSVGVVIPYYNCWKNTVKLLKTIEWYSEQKKYDITCILVSDGSDKDTENKIDAYLQQVKNYRYEKLTGEHHGYIVSVNAGIQYSVNRKFDYTVIMHNDIQVSYNWLRLLQEFDDRTFMTVPITNCEYDQRQNISYIRQSEILEDFPESFQKCKTATINQMLEKYEGQKFKLDQNLFIPGNFCMALRTCVFQQLGKFKQKYKIGFGQDIQFFYRFLRAGYTGYFIPSVYIPHDGRITFSLVYSGVQDFGKQAVLKHAVNEISLSLNFRKIKKHVIYAYGGQQPPKFSEYNIHDFDYVYFGKQKPEQPWIFINTKKIKKLANSQNQQLIRCFFKTHPHLFFQNYLTSIYVQDTVDFIQDPKNIADLLFEDQYLIKIFSSMNPQDMIKFQIQRGYDIKKNIFGNIDKLKSVKLLNTQLIIRNHMNIESIKLMQEWWKSINQITTADSLVLSYLLSAKQDRFLSVYDDQLTNKYIQFKKQSLWVQNNS